MAKGDDIEERLIDFAVVVVRLCRTLPKDEIGKPITAQLIRSGTAPAAHYAEARGAESTRDFIHKMRLCLKELNESRVWLKIIERSELQPVSNLEMIAKECDELCRIINASIKTATNRQR